MLSTPNSSIERRRTLHRRQNSTPQLESANVRPVPAIVQRQAHQRHHRRGMSLDISRLAYKRMRSPPLSSLITTPTHEHESTVSITNQPIGQDFRQHPTQVAQLQCRSQQGHPHPIQGPQAGYSPDPTQYDASFPAHSQPVTPRSPRKTPEERLREFRERINEFSDLGIIQVNILPTPMATPQKRTNMGSHGDNLDVAPMPPSFGDVTEISLDPPGMHQVFSMNVDNPESERENESSCYSSDAFSPERSPTVSPQARSAATFSYSLTQAPPLSFSPSTSSYLPSSQASEEMGGLHSSPQANPGSPSAGVQVAGMYLNASIEDTGISAAEVQSYIGEQDPVNHKWTCLFPQCGKTFGRKENIKAHVQTHLGDRQFRCNECNKCFVRQHDLKRHAKIHFGDKPHKCLCGTAFQRQDALTRHRQRGMCEGAFPNAVRKTARRGRPKKKRPELEQRVEKALRARMMDKEEEETSAANHASGPYASSLSGQSDVSYPMSPAASSPPFDAAQFATLGGDAQEDVSFSDLKFSIHEIETETVPFPTSPSATGGATCETAVPMSGEYDLPPTLAEAELPGIIKWNSLSADPKTPPASPPHGTISPAQLGSPVKSVSHSFEAKDPSPFGFNRSQLGSGEETPPTSPPEPGMVPGAADAEAREEELKLAEDLKMIGQDLDPLGSSAVFGDVDLFGDVGMGGAGPVEWNEENWTW